MAGKASSISREEDARTPARSLHARPDRAAGPGDRPGAAGQGRGAGAVFDADASETGAMAPAPYDEGAMNSPRSRVPGRCGAHQTDERDEGEAVRSACPRRYEIRPAMGAPSSTPASSSACRPQYGSRFKPKGRMPVRPGLDTSSR